MKLYLMYMNHVGTDVVVTAFIKTDEACKDIKFSVDNKPTRCHFCVMLYFLLYKLLNMFRAAMCPSSGADDWLVFRHVLVLYCSCRKVVKTGW